MLDANSVLIDLALYPRRLTAGSLVRQRRRWLLQPDYDPLEVIQAPEAMSLPDVGWWLLETCGPGDVYYVALEEDVLSLRAQPESRVAGEVPGGPPPPAFFQHWVGEERWLAIPRHFAGFMPSSEFSQARQSYGVTVYVRDTPLTREALRQLQPISVHRDAIRYLPVHLRRWRYTVVCQHAGSEEAASGGGRLTAVDATVRSVVPSMPALRW